MSQIKETNRKSVRKGTKICTQVRVTLHQHIFTPAKVKSIHPRNWMDKIAGKIYKVFCKKKKKGFSSSEKLKTSIM